jgi:hypothetical protein
MPWEREMSRIWSWPFKRGRPRIYKEAKCMYYGGHHAAFSKNCGKRADEKNRLMAAKNVSAKEARKLVKTTDHSPPISPAFRPTQ